MLPVIVDTFVQNVKTLLDSPLTVNVQLSDIMTIMEKIVKSVNPSVILVKILLIVKPVKT